jgi:hypothetical protein
MSLECGDGELYFTQQMKHLKAPVIDFKPRRSRETWHAAGESGEEIHRILRHDSMGEVE